MRVVILRGPISNPSAPDIHEFDNFQAFDSWVAGERARGPWTPHPDGDARVIWDRLANGDPQEFILGMRKEDDVTWYLTVQTWEPTVNL